MGLIDFFKSNRYLKSNRSKFLVLLFLFAMIVFSGGILFTLGLAFRRRTLLFRMSYMLIAVLWVVLTIRAICVKVNIKAIWQGMISEFYGMQENYERTLSRRYQDLLSRYPMAVAEYESHCWHQDPRPTNSEIMESALAISEQEWVDREVAAKKKIADKSASHNS